jgi:sugar phosphate isomerase/epimerase
MPATDLLDLAARVDLSGVEIAPDIVAPTGAREDLLAFRKHAHELKLSITISGSQAAGPDAVARLMPLFDAAEALGARRVRLTLSAILCGDRRPVGGIDGWRRLLEATVPNLETLAHAAGARGLRLAVENHQDATAEDLVWLCEAVGHPAMGITLDCGNPLAVGQEILP